jgi:transposase
MSGSSLVVRSPTNPGWFTFILTGISNAKHEGLNRVIKLEARNAYGFRNPANQRLRSRCATTRGSRNRAIPA